MSSLKYSEVESKRFGKVIFRGSMGVLDIEALKKFYNYSDPDILIMRLPVSEQYKLHLLSALDRDVINADTLVYYEVDLANTIYNHILNEELAFVTANETHKTVFEQLIPQIFVGYTNHYFSNPLLDKKKITEGYVEWAINTFDHPGNLHILVYSGELAVGFITCSFDGQTAEIVLNGVLPEFQRKGFYSDTIRHVKKHYRDINAQYLKISTQIQNFAVQKVWNREGFVLNKAYITIHLNKKEHDSI